MTARGTYRLAVFDQSIPSYSCRSDTPLSHVFTDDFWGLPLTNNESHKSYRPLTTLSFRLNYLLHGLWTPGFHAVNIAIHSTVCVLYYCMLQKLGVDGTVNMVASVLFAAHPIHTEAVCVLSLTHLTFL